MSHKTEGKTTEVKKKSCFIAMPISTPEHTVSQYGGDTIHFRHVMEQLIIPAVEKAGLEAIPPASTGSDIIHAEIIQQLEKADLVLVDMSTLNPNVFFELGIRVALDKPICLIKDEKSVKVPFDTTIINHHVYSSGLLSYTQKNDIEELSRHIKASIDEKPDKLSLWRIFSLSSRAKVSAATNPSTDQLLELINSRLESLTHLVLDNSRQNISKSINARSGNQLAIYNSVITALHKNGINGMFRPNGDSIEIVSNEELTDKQIEQIILLEETYGVTITWKLNSHLKK